MFLPDIDVHARAGLGVPASRCGARRGSCFRGSFAGVCACEFSVSCCDTHIHTCVCLQAAATAAATRTFTHPRIQTRRRRRRQSARRRWLRRSAPPEATTLLPEVTTTLPEVSTPHLEVTAGAAAEEEGSGITPGYSRNTQATRTARRARRALLRSRPPLSARPQRSPQRSSLQTAARGASRARDHRGLATPTAPWRRGGRSRGSTEALSALHKYFCDCTS